MAVDHGPEILRTAVARFSNRESTIRRLLCGGTWTFAGTGVFSASSLLASVMCSRFLGGEGFGRISALVSTMGLCALFAGLGMGLTATKHVAEYRDSDPARIGRIIALLESLMMVTCAIAGAVLYFGSDWLAVSFFHDALLAPYFKLGVPWLIGFVYNEVAMATLAGFEAFQAVATAQFLRAVVLVGGTWIGLHRLGALGAVWALTFSVAISAVTLTRKVHAHLRAHKIDRDYQGMLRELPLIRTYSIPAVLAGVVMLPFTFCANGLIARHVGMRELGLVSAVGQWRGLMTFFPVNLAKVGLAVLSKKSSVLSDASDSFEATNWLNQMLLWPAALFLLFAGRRVLSLNGPDFVAGIGIHEVMIGGTAAGFVGNVLGTAIQSRGWFGVGILGNLLTGLAIGMCTWGLVGSLGAQAMSWGYFVGYATNFVLCGYVVTRRLRVRRDVWPRMQIAGLCMVGCMVLAWYLRGGCSWVGGIAFALAGTVYAAVMFAPGSVRTFVRNYWTARTRPYLV